MAGPPNMLLSSAIVNLRSSWALQAVFPITTCAWWREYFRVIVCGMYPEKGRRITGVGLAESAVK